MASTTEPNLGIHYGWAERESGWKTGMDENLLRLGSLVQLAVLTTDSTNPPPTPAFGDRHLVPAITGGAWIGHEHQVTIWNGSAWIFFAPKPGWLLYDIANDTYMAYREGSWSSLSI